jgi:hypothetical protein
MCDLAAANEPPSLAENEPRCASARVGAPGSARHCNRAAEIRNRGGVEGEAGGAEEEQPALREAAGGP